MQDLAHRMLSWSQKHTEIAFLEPHGTPDWLSWVHMGPGDGSPRAKCGLRGQILDTFIKSEGWGGGPGAEGIGVGGGIVAHLGPLEPLRNRS